MNSTNLASRSAVRWAVFAVLATIVIAAIKTVAWWVTDSTALLSDAIESVVNLVASSFALYAVWLSSQPRDEDHPYGHGKVEYFAAGVEGALIVSAAATILWSALPRFFGAPPLERLEVGAGLAALNAILMFGVGRLLERAGERLESPSLVADGKHLITDAVTTASVFVGVVIVMLTGARWLDVALAVVMAAWLLATGVRIVRSAVGGLMDEANPALLDRIGAFLFRMRRPGWVAPHRTRVHRLGPMIHVDIHLVFPRFWSLEQTHDAAEELEAAFAEEFGPRSELMIHMEPCTERSCAYCDLPDCPVRAERFEALMTWDHETMTGTRPPARWLRDHSHSSEHATLPDADEGTT